MTVGQSFMGYHGSMPEEGARWYVAQTKPCSENRAFLNLKRQNYYAFSPQTRKAVRHARKLSARLVPLFPSYLFIRLDLGHQAWSAINNTYGVSRLIMQNERPRPVPAGLVESLQAQVGADGVFSWAVTLEIGQLVRIAEGPFADLVAVLEHLDSAGRVRVLLDILGRSVPVALRREVLAPAV